MSFTAKGTFVRLSANRTIAVFVINKIQYTFYAIDSSFLKPFTSSNAIVHCNDMNNLASPCTYYGTIGKNTFNLTLEDDVVIDGTLDDPGIPLTAVKGLCVWEKN